MNYSNLILRKKKKTNKQTNKKQTNKQKQKQKQRITKCNLIDA